MLVAAEGAIASHELTFLATLLAVVLSIQVTNHGVDHCCG